MAKKRAKKSKKKQQEQLRRPKEFLDLIAPAAAKFNTDHFVLGSRYHTALAIKSYPPMTDELALLRGLGDMGGVNLRITARQVTPAEEDAIFHAATNKNRMERSNTNDYKQSVNAEAALRDMAELLIKQRQEKEPLIHCAVYADISAPDMEHLKTLRDTVSAQFVRSKISADPLRLRQREGFRTVDFDDIADDWLGGFVGVVVTEGVRNTWFGNLMASDEMKNVSDFQIRNGGRDDFFVGIVDVG